MNAHLLLIFGFGILVLLIAWLPQLLSRMALSLSIVCIGIGFATFALGNLPLNVGVPEGESTYERIAEAVLLIALMGAGLKIDRPLGMGSWSTAWRLILVGMPLMMVVTFLLAIGWGQISVAGAVFLAGVMTPTDPVLASDVSVGHPGKGEEGEVRFGLTVEAALNDGLAFPVVSLAIALAAGEAVGVGWVANEFVWQVVLGIAIGWATGTMMGWLTFHAPRARLSNAGAGLVALGTAALAFGVSEMASGNGFIAVFVTAMRLRASCPADPFHYAMADFAEQIERVLVMIVLVLFGGALSKGLLSPLRWSDAALVLVLLFVARPLTAWLSLRGLAVHPIARATIAFFGIRGIGTIYYVVYVMTHGHLAEEGRLVAMAALAVLASVLVHGASATPLMQWVDRKREAAQTRGKSSA